MPAALEIIETPPSPIGRATAATLIAFLVIALVWACVGRIDIIATAQGKIVPTGHTKMVQPLDTGQITAILVQDGDHVGAGQVVVRLDQTTAFAERNHIGHDLVGAKLDAARLTALRLAADAAAEPSLVPPDEASPAQILRERAEMMAQAAAQQHKVAAIEEQIAQKNAESESIAANITKLEASLPLLAEEADIRKKAMAIEFGNRIAHLDAQIRVTDQTNELAVQRRRAVEITAARQALERQRSQAISEYLQKVLSDLSEAEQKAAALAEDLAKANQKIEQAVLRAPVEGTVQQLAVHSLGGVVTPAQVLMMIVPIDSHPEAEVMVSNRDIGFVSPGQEAEIKVDTFNFTRYGLLRGRVTNLSQDAITRDKAPDKAGGSKLSGTFSESSEPQGQELIYSARIGLDGTQLNIDGRMINVSPGMAISAEIKTGQRRIIEYLLSPLLRYKQDALRER
ncbi:HlyD family type I secretion periplasmic adaptor subunit [Bradyrhizobium ottawaense]|uniref:HlyD family type I secretion periplasmic adaptor subunit n=1 Tax=Bradyrhizobium ottawaense TaxID=931866 RepID=UPI0035192866